MKSDIITRSEIIACTLLHGKYGSTDEVNFHEAANKIVLLAEQIKAERSVVNMN